MQICYSDSIDTLEKILAFFTYNIYSYCYLLLQHHVLMVPSGFEVVQTFTRVEWKSATIMHGALCVMTPGVVLMQELCTDSLDSQQ